MGIYKLGFCYENGLGTEANLDRAIELYKKAADNNLTEAKEALKRLNKQINR
jgi:TPR repeat protein